MTDREKVIKDLHDIAGFIAGRVGIEQTRNFMRTIDDTVALLKEDCHNCKLECLLQKYDELKEKYDKLLKEQETVVRCKDCKECLSDCFEPWDVLWKAPDGTFKGRCYNCGFVHVFIEGHITQYKFCPQCGEQKQEL